MPNSADLQAKINAAVSGGIGDLVQIKEWYDLDAPVSVPPNVKGLILAGTGEWSSGFNILHGAQGDTIFDFVNHRESAILNLGVEVYGGAGINDTGPPHAVNNRLENIFRFGMQSGVPGFLSTRPAIENVRIECRNRARFGLRYSGPNDENNEWGEHYRVMIANYAFAAVGIEQAQAKGHRFKSCIAAGNGFGNVGVYATNGSFTWLDGKCGGNNIDFYLGTPNQDPIEIQNCDSENSKQLLLVANQGAGKPIRISGTRFMSANILTTVPVVELGSFVNMELCNSIFRSDTAGQFARFDLDYSHITAWIHNLILRTQGSDTRTQNPFIFNAANPHNIRAEFIQYTDAAGNAIASRDWDINSYLETP